MISVDPDATVVEEQLTGGELFCPDCGGSLKPWGHARERVVRQLRSLSERIRPRRSCCRRCSRTHVLLPCSMLVRRADSVEVIGEALQAKADEGLGFRPTATVLGLPECTVRGWLRRFTIRAEHWRVVFTKMAASLSPQLESIRPRASVLADAVEVIGLAATGATARFGPRSPWWFAAQVSGGSLLAPAADRG
jgi:hypothetical protein